MKNRLFLLFAIVMCSRVNAQHVIQDHSSARVWMDMYLEAIKEDGQGPTVHARNLFHLSTAMYDTWEVYNGGSLNTLFLGKTMGGYDCPFDGFVIPNNADSALNVSINYAAFRFMMGKWEHYSSKVRVNDLLIAKFDSLGFNSNFSSTDYSNGSAAALGNYIAEQLVMFALQEPAGDEDGYEVGGYEPINAPMKPSIPGNKTLAYKNRWQPLSVVDYINKKGWDSTLLEWNFQLILNEDVFLTPHWGNITPFAMSNVDMKKLKRDGVEYLVYNDPGPPPYLGKDELNSEFYKWNFSLVSSWGCHNDPADEAMIDISPSAIGSTKGILPVTFEEYQRFFNLLDGGCNTAVQKLNPKTNEVYEANLVKRGDYTRVIAEYWVDGVNTMSPPGHWIDMFNEVSDSPGFQRKWQGVGKKMEPLEWDVKSYLAISGALHDAGISAWSTKVYYDYIRPISAIRWMAQNGQCTDSSFDNFHKEGLPLIEGRIEVVDKDDVLVGEKMEHLGKIKLYTWKGPDKIGDVHKDVAGVGWILAENWWPYQRYSFTTPPFAGYVSGHSTFSVAAAEIITAITGDPYFPGGLKEISFKKDQFLEFENGPSEDITLQWATYREAADETCLSRIWGGIHPPVDDIEGRKIGEKVAKQSLEFVNKLFKGL